MTQQEQIKEYQMLLAQQANLIERQEKEITFLIKANMALEQERDINLRVWINNPIALMQKEGKA